MWKYTKCWKLIYRDLKEGHNNYYTLERSLEKPLRGLINRDPGKFNTFSLIKFKPRTSKFGSGVRIFIKGLGLIVPNLPGKGTLPKGDLWLIRDAVTIVASEGVLVSCWHRPDAYNIRPSLVLTPHSTAQTRFQDLK